MHDEQITALFRQLRDADDVLRESPIFQDQSERRPFPLIPVELQRVPLSRYEQFPERISYMPVVMERVELDVDDETIARIRQHPEAMTKILNAFTQRIDAELHLAFRYGIICYGGIPHARQFAEAVHPSPPHHG